MTEFLRPHPGDVRDATEPTTMTRSEAIDHVFKLSYAVENEFGGDGDAETIAALHALGVTDDEIHAWQDDVDEPEQPVVANSDPDGTIQANPCPDGHTWTLAPGVAQRCDRCPATASYENGVLSISASWPVRGGEPL